MGNLVQYRSTPERIHTTEEGRSPYYKYGVSQITGWRSSQEDRYICLPKFYEDFSMFAVYDGHGRSHAVQYLYRFMHQHILKELITHKDPELALYLGFVTTDLCLRHITKKELDVIEDDLDLAFQVAESSRISQEISQTYLRTRELLHDNPSTKPFDKQVGEAGNLLSSIMEVSETPISECSTEESPSKNVHFIEPDNNFCKATGSTATVLLLNGKRLYIANIGDSRCVACVDGQAVDLTVAHKPTKEEETNRINNAGGSVKDGRVSGILDMSRTFGDFEFKEKNMAEPFQMLSCEPFITSLNISDKLEFLILASDGIWNTMDSQDVVNYVKNRMQDIDMELQDICGEMFELLLPTAVTVDGSGCDNLTAILIVFNKEQDCYTHFVNECYSYNYSFCNGENTLSGRRRASVQKSTSPSLHTENLQNEGECSSKDHCMPETDDNSIPLEPIPSRSPSGSPPSYHCDSDNEDTSHPSKRFKPYHTSIQFNHLDPRNVYYTHYDNSQARPLNLVRHAGDICDDKNEPEHCEGSKNAENISVTDYFLNHFQDMRNFMEITREKIKIVDNDLRAAMSEMDMKLTDLLKYTEFADKFGDHCYFRNLNKIQERTNSLFQLNSNMASTFSNLNSLNSEQFFKPFTSYDRQPTYADILPNMQPTYVEAETQRNKSTSNQKASQSTSAEVLIVDLTSDEDEIHVNDNSGGTPISVHEASAMDNSDEEEIYENDNRGGTPISDDETPPIDNSDEKEIYENNNSGGTPISDKETSSIDNSKATEEVDSCSALQVSEKSNEEEPLREKDGIKTQGEL